MAAVSLTNDSIRVRHFGERTRAEITSLPITISTPGKYYLTSNLAAVGTGWNIVITASNVVLDLMGKS